MNLIIVPAEAQQKYKFALVAPSNIEYYAGPGGGAVDGCLIAETELGGTVACNPLVSPATSYDEVGQATELTRIISSNYDGVAIAPINGANVFAALAAAKAAGIPVVTYSIDLPAAQAGLRDVFVGSVNSSIGMYMARYLMQIMPKGGALCIQSRYDTAQTDPIKEDRRIGDDQRIRGLRDTLAGQSGTAKLSGQNGWTEIADCPVYLATNISDTMSKLDGIFKNNPLDMALVSVGGIEDFSETAYRDLITQNTTGLKKRRINVVLGDTFPLRKNLINDGLLSAQISQRPKEMGYLAINYLNEIMNGNTPPSSPVSSGVEVCRIDNVTTCTGE
ncbi:substrate-binding domain-containing protein [Rhizobium brockwellii]